MKNKTIIALVACVLCLCNISKAQTNSVDLKDRSGTLLSQHNSITAAYAAIPSTISKSYVVELSAAYDASTETFPISLDVRTRTSNLLNIIIMPAAGVTSMMIMDSISGSMFVLDGADYIIVDGRPGGTGTTGVLGFYNSSTATGANTISLINGATYNRIQYCDIYNGTTTNLGRGIFFGSSSGSSGGNSNNAVEYCRFPLPGRCAINSNGSTIYPNTGNRIYGCEITDVVHAGIWYQLGTSDMLIDSNIIRSTWTTGTGMFGMLLENVRGNVEINQNHIYGLDNGALTTQVRGIRVVSTSSTNSLKITNNFISLAATNGSSLSVAGLEYAALSLTTLTIYHNTILIGGTLSSGGNPSSILSAAFLKSGGNTNATFNIRNNIFINKRSGGSSTQHLAVAITNMNGILDMDYNFFDVASANFARLGVTAYSTMAAYKGALLPNESNTNKTTVFTVSDTDLHLTGTSIGDTALACINTGIYTDIDHEYRSSTAYRGADEVADYPLPPISMAPVYSGMNSLNKELRGSEVYPNPFNDHFMVKLNDVKEGNATMEITDIQGRIVKTFTQHLTHGTMQWNIDGLPTLKPGIYFVTVRCNEFTKAVKLIKQ